MKIRRISLRNLHSIRGDVEIDFTKSPLVETGLFAITGDTGAGKTTILDAVTLALYGNLCRKSDARETLSHGSEEGMAECEFEAKGRRFLAQWRVRQTRSKKPGQALKTERSVAEWEEKSSEFHIVAERRVREVNSFIEQVTGLDFPRFTRSVMLAQGDFAAFLKANEKERSDLLERITGTEIYSELSKAALERKNIEKAQLDSLTEKRDTLNIFSKEEIKEIKAVLKQKQKEYKANSKALEKAKSNLQQLQELEKLERQERSVTAAIEKLAERAAEFKDDQQKLEAHQKTLPLHPTLARFDDKAAEIGQLEKSIESLTGQESRLERESASLQIVFSEKKKAFDILKKEQPKAIRLFDQVSTLDTKIQGLEATFQKQKTEQDEALRQLETANLERAELESKIAAHLAAIEELTAWLKENAAWANLPKDLPTIAHIRSGLNENFLAQKDLKAKIVAANKKLAGAETAKLQLEKKLLSENGTLGKLTASFKEKAREAFTDNRHDLLEKLNKDIEALAEQQKHRLQLNGLSSEYSKTLAEINALKNELDNLRSEELTLDKAFLSAVEQSEEAEQVLRFKQEVFRQQQSIANYEKDRAALAEGEPCPLCFSTEHPFRDKGLEAYIDRAKAELEVAEKFYKQKQAERTELVKRHLEIASKIQQMDGGPSGQLGKLEARLMETEKKMAALFPNLDGEDFSRSVGDWLVKKIDGFEENLKAKKETRKQLAELNGQLSAQESIVRKLETELKDSGFEELETKKSVQHAEENLASLAKNFEQLTNDLNQLVEKYGYTFSLDRARAMFADLKNKEKLFSDNQEKASQHERLLALDKQSLQQVQKTITALERKTTALDKELKKESAQLNRLKTKRLELFDEKDPNEERERLIHELEQLETSLEGHRTRFEETKNALALTKQSLKAETRRLEKEKKSFRKIEESLQKGLAKAGFENVEILRSAKLSAAKAQGLQVKSERLKQQEIETQQQLRTIGKALKTARKKPLPEKTMDELGGEINQLENNSIEIQQALGALQQQLKDNDERQSESEQLLSQIEDQRTTYNRWMALYDLIGSADGKKFRVFAQGLTLQKLVQLANAHLENLFGRYIIMKRPGEDLELDIVDTFQADNIRSMHTLSGGESFLVSLALALGLSDLAGKDANIKTLFIDEGFGTLDDQTLDLALVTLENLQAKGKTIGIISHVKELKERISTQVRVVKKGGGMSSVEVIG